MTDTLFDNNLVYLKKFTSQKVERPSLLPVGEVPDSLAAWMVRYLTLAVVGVRSDNVARKIALHLQRFASFYRDAYGHERISNCLRRDVLAWQRELLSQGLAPATVNNHLASLSSFTTWVQAQAPRRFPIGDPAKGIGELGLPPLEPRTLSPEQIRSLKNLCDWLERFHQKRARQWGRGRGEVTAPTRATGRP